MMVVVVVKGKEKKFSGGMSNNNNKDRRKNIEGCVCVVLRLQKVKSANIRINTCNWRILTSINNDSLECAVNCNKEQ